jgi:hypothetical protein
MFRNKEAIYIVESFSDTSSCTIKKASRKQFACENLTLNLPF